MRVEVFYTGSSTSPQQFVQVSDGSTVRTALSQAGVPTENVSVRVNRTDATLDTVLGAEDKIVVTAKNLKGAAEVDSITLTMEQIIGWGKGDGSVASTVVGKAMAKQAERAQELLLDVVQGLIAEAKPTAASINKQIANLEKELAEAKDGQKRFAYALDQLVTKENPFALLAVMGRKDKAASLCHAIGCDVPDAKSVLWKTSSED